MNYIVLTYTLYLITSIVITIWVAKTLHKNGRIFLIDCFHGNEELADSINHLLVVGFYLVNVGFISLFLKLSTPILLFQEVLEALSWKIGVVLLVLGVMHFFNLYLFNKMRKKALLQQAPPPVQPTTTL